MAVNQAPQDSAAPSGRDPEGIAFIDNDFALRDTVDVLAQTLKELGQAGKPVAASRLAAQAWQVLRQPHPQEAQRINNLMHYLARLPEEVDPHADEHSDDDAAEQEIDVRELPHGQRHTIIFATYAALAPGHGFTLVNDHDPRPLYYQFDAEHRGDFTWDYTEQGPRTWRVRIGRPASA
jgi:uncharacterized protein (DUF2249 family)